MLGVRRAGGGGGVGTRRGDAFNGEYNDVEGKKERVRGDDGDKQPASSLSISLSNFTSSGGSTPYLRERYNKKCTSATRTITELTVEVLEPEALQKDCRVVGTSSPGGGSMNTNMHQLT